MRACHHHYLGVVIQLFGPLLPMSVRLLKSLLSFQASQSPFRKSAEALGGDCLQISGSSGRVLYPPGSHLHCLVISAMISNPLNMFCSLSLVVLDERFGTCYRIILVC